MNTTYNQSIKWIEDVTIEKEIIPQSKIIKEDKNPIFIWGCGTLAIQVYGFCKKFSINIEGCFVNTEEKEHDFNGIPVYGLDEVAEKYIKFSVIIGHANYAEGVKLLRKIRNVEKIYCLSSVCYNKTELISEVFLKRERLVLNDLYNDLQDGKSKECLKAYFKSRINDKSEYMFSYYDNGTNYYNNDVIRFSENETLLDIGACMGSAIWSFVDAVQGNYKAVIAIEPDKDNYSFLVNKIEEREMKRVIVKQVCAYNKNTFVRFCGSMEGGGINETSLEGQLYPAKTIDSMCEEINALWDTTIVKINFVGPVSEVLEGAKKLLKEKKPKLVIRIGYDENIMIKTYLSIKNINPTYKVYMRYTLGIPQGLTIFAI